MHKFLCTHNTLCVHVMCMVVIMHAICEDLKYYIRKNEIQYYWQCLLHLSENGSLYK